MPSPYYRYQTRTIGNVLHFLYHYCGLHIAEHAIVGSDIVYNPHSDEEIEENILATFFFDSHNYPVFEFRGDRAAHYMKQQELYREKAIRDME